ncbi:hypothetical protein [Cetobacterium sp.]|uniref:hypothetical protein n=1 Tax=Cetobacterium sp. TaxID=2071632 RepID=UPI003F2A7ACF
MKIIKYYQVSKSKAKKHEFMLYGIKNHETPPLNSDCIIYKGYDLPENIYFDGEKIRESTRYERIRDGVSSLFENEFIKDGVIYNILDFKQIEGAIKQEFDFDKMEWIETATEEEKRNSEMLKYKNFYLKELQLSTLAQIEFEVGLLTEQEYNNIKFYIRAINPYKEDKIQQTKSVAVIRPEVLNRY